jgi:hypothetical protein
MIRLVDNILLELKGKTSKLTFFIFFINKLKILFHFRQTPDDNNIIVFNKGNSNGLIPFIPIGGH